MLAALPALPHPPLLLTYLPVVVVDAMRMCLTLAARRGGDAVPDAQHPGAKPRPSPTPKI